MWTDYYLKFNDESAFMAAMSAGQNNEQAYNTPDTCALDPVGTLFHHENGTAVAGFHANLRLKGETPVPENLMPFVIPAPQIPKRVFA